MKTYLVSLLAASTLIGVSVTHSRDSGSTVKSAATVSAIRPAAQLDRATRALTAYVNACAEADGKRLQEALTEDAAIELPFPEPGTYFVVDSANATAFCNPSGASGDLTSLKMYPAGDRTFFAAFDQHGGSPRLVLLEIRGSRIARLRDFTADSEQVKRYAAGHQKGNLRSPP